VQKHIIKLIFLGVFLVIAPNLLMPKVKNIDLSNGLRIHVTKPHWWRDIFPEANTKMRVEMKSGRKGNVSLWQDVFDGPIYVLPGTNTNAFFCLYDFDTCYCLFRIDSGLPFQPVPTNSRLYRILFTSDCYIREATYFEWHEVMDELQKTSSSDFSRQRMRLDLRVRETPQSILNRLRSQTVPPD